ncbi:hypothetical protein ATB98_00735 [Sinorhizobium saheli]|uniref:ISRM5 transposase n=1 Tax=Sinorhizobium saheli TaxID=36856 RepID=D1CTF4_SINSA|nr:ISRM5 transposase [Sinorhizobium saheli]OAP39497.1 hypothetical protein ATB98_00735 [Sinorhizobium saheli]
MTKTENRTTVAAVRDILLSNPDALRVMIRAVMQQVLKAEVDEAIGQKRASARWRRSAIALVITAAR